MAEKLYSIKEIAALCNLSRKQLLYYEEKGLIENVVRGENNYRYYTKEHLAKLVFMKEAREAGFSVETIDYLLKNNTTKALKPAVYQAMIEARKEPDQSIAKYQESVERYHSLLEAAYISESYQVGSLGEIYEVVQVPAKNVVRYQYQSNSEDDPFRFYQEYAKLDAIVKQYRLTKVSPKIYKFHNHFDVEAEVFLSHDHDIQLLYQVKEEESRCPSFTTIPGFLPYTLLCWISVMMI